jgi:hypothetical protein
VSCPENTELRCPLFTDSRVCYRNPAPGARRPPTCRATFIHDWDDEPPTGELRIVPESAGLRQCVNAGGGSLKGCVKE